MARGTVFVGVLSEFRGIKECQRVSDIGRECQQVEECQVEAW